MTPALATLLICIAGAALVVAIGTYFWVNRTLPGRERFDRYGRVPLFGVNLGASGAPVNAADLAKQLQVEHDDAAEDEAHVNVNSRSRAGGSTAVRDMSAKGYAGPIASLRPGAAATDATAFDSHLPRSSSQTPPRSAPVPLSPMPASAVSVPSVSPPPAAPAPRPGGNGWGERPGWPVEFTSGVPSRPDAERSSPPAPSVLVAGSNPRSAPGDSGNGKAASGAPLNGRGNDVVSGGVPGSMIEGHGVRFSIPAEGTLQFLPGRLEISAGLDAGREIRFVRVPGPNGTEVTFGRNEGPLYRHIQLRDQTVSREHARMSLSEGQWKLCNLSRTNPVALNGRILGLSEERPLQEGDRVEMGEVAFTFRSR